VSDAEAQLQGFIDRFEPAIADLARACRDRLRRRFPAAFELVYDNYNALAIGYAPSQKTSDCMVSLALYPRNARLFFYWGAELADPGGRLSGTGNQVRSIQLTGPEVFDDPQVRALLDAAEANPRHSRWGEAGGTIIKSVSAKQRPRRPAASSV
jgi:hypothetical protein